MVVLLITKGEFKLLTKAPLERFKLTRVLPTKMGMLEIHNVASTETYKWQ
jgi:hypothetical protein